MNTRCEKKMGENYNVARKCCGSNLYESVTDIPNRFLCKTKNKLN